MTDINIQDIDAVVRIIDTVTARGAFRGPELTAVGQVREKFASVIQAEVEKQQAAQGNGAVKAPLQPSAPSAPSAANEGAPATEEGEDLSKLN